MPADQAAGLRRRSELQPLRCIHCYFEAVDSCARLAHALHQQGRVSLMVDTRGRSLADFSPRSLFDWRKQLARGELQLRGMPYGDAWHAPGVRADEPALRRAALGYDLVLFDAEPGAAELILMPDASHAVIVEVQPTGASMLRAFALVKTLSRAGHASGTALVGDAAACQRLVAACGRFLDRGYGETVYNAAQEHDAFAALAVRMAGEEASRMARYNTGKS
jgi:hypothetical protein